MIPFEKLSCCCQKRLLRFKGFTIRNPCQKRRKTHLNRIEPGAVYLQVEQDQSTRSPPHHLLHIIIGVLALVQATYAVPLEAFAARPPTIERSPFSVCAAETAPRSRSYDNSRLLSCSTCSTGWVFRSSPAILPDSTWLAEWVATRG